MTVSGLAARRYRADIDGLRAIAVTSVVLFHAGVGFLPSGFTGVDIFFAISGYLIGGIVFEEVRAGTFSFANFYARRARRILPALLCVVSFACVAGLALLSQGELTGLASESFAALIGISNIKFFFYNDYFQDNSELLPMLMTWSLGVEEQFYVLFPWIILWGKARGARRTALILGTLSFVSLIACIVTTTRNPTAAFYLLPWRAWELGLGALLAIHHLYRSTCRQRGTANVLAAVGLGMLGVSLACIGKDVPFPGYAAILPIAGTLLLIHAQPSWINQRLLSARPVVFTGLISYSWYLWHWPMMAFSRIILGEGAEAVMLPMAAFSFMAAFASWKWVEQPFRKAVRPASGDLWRYGMALALALAVTTGIKKSQGIAGRMPEAVVKVEHMIALGRGSCLSPFGSTKPDASEACLPVADGRPGVALLGDSHASALGPGLQQWAEQHSARLLQLTKSACAPMLGVAAIKTDIPSHAEACLQFMDGAVERVLGDDSIRAVVVAGVWPKSDNTYAVMRDGVVETTRLSNVEAMKAGMVPLVARLRAAGKQVTLVGDVPAFRFDPARHAVTEGMPARRWLAQHLAPLDGVRDGVAARELAEFQDGKVNPLLRETAKAQGAIFVDLQPLFCSDSGCRFQEGDALLYIDKHHLSTAGSKAISWPMRAEFIGQP